MAIWYDINDGVNIITGANGMCFKTNMIAWENDIKRELWGYKQFESECYSFYT